MRRAFRRLNIVSNLCEIWLENFVFLTLRNMILGRIVPWEQISKTTSAAIPLSEDFIMGIVIKSRRKLLVWAVFYVVLIRARKL